MPPSSDAAEPRLLGGDARRQVLRMHAAVPLFFAIDGVLMGGFSMLGLIAGSIGPAFAIGGCTLSSLFMYRFWRRGGRVDELNALSLVLTAIAGVAMLATLVAAPQIGGLMLMSMMSLVSLGAVPLGMPALLGCCLVLSGASGALLAWTGEAATIPSASGAERALTGVWFTWLMVKATAHNAVSRRLRRRVDRVNAKLAEALLDLEHLAATDELTVLPNRRSIVGRLQVALDDPPEAAGGRVGVAVLDIDHFKGINDRHGHEVGDRVLRVFAELAAAGLRPSDRIGRYGGEEFLLVLQKLPDARAALDATERLRARVEAHDWQRVVPGLAVTVSAGVAVVRPKESSGAAIQRADAALYDAKRGGRNRVVMQDAAADI